MGKTISTILNLGGNFANKLKENAGSVKQFQRQIQHTQNSIKSFKDSAVNSLKSVGKGLGGALAGIGILEIGRQSIMLASDLQEVQNVVDTTFGSGAKQIDDWSKTALKNFGLSELQAKQFNGTLGALMKSSGISTDKLGEMSTGLTGLAGDFASFYNLKPEEAFEKIKSGISGETEPLKALGINMSVANLEAFALTQGINKQWKEMTQAEQVQLRYNYLLKSSKDAQGDFVKTNKGFANQLRIAGTTLKQVGATLGGYLLPILNLGLQGFNNLLDVLPKFGNEVKGIFTGATSGADIFTPIMEGITDVLYSKLPQGVANFFSSIIGTILGFFTDIYDNTVRIIRELKNPFMDFVDSVKNIFGTVGGTVAQMFDSVTKSNYVKVAFEAIKKSIEDIFKVATSTFNFISNNWTIIKPIVEGIAIAFGVYKTALLITKGVLMGVAMAQKAFNIICSINPFTFILIGIGLIIAAGLLLYQNWGRITAWLGNNFTWLKNQAVAIFTGISNWINNNVLYIKNIIINVWNSIITAITNNPFFKIIESIFKGILAVIIIVFSSIYVYLATTLTTIWGYITAIWNSIYSSISSVVTSIWTTITAIWNSIYTSVSSVVISIWNSIVSIWTSIYTSISSVVTSIWTTITDGFNSAKDGAVGIFTSMADAVSNAFGNVWEGIKSIINGGIGLINGFIGGVNKVIEKANSIPGVNIGVVGEIPALAKGGIATTPSICGEAGAEAVIPLKRNNARSKMLLEQADTAVNGNKTSKSDSNNVYVIIQGNVIGNREYADYVADVVLEAINNV